MRERKRQGEKKGRGKGEENRERKKTGEDMRGGKRFGNIRHAYFLLKLYLY